MTLVRSLTVAKLLSIGFVVRRCRQCSAGKSKNAVSASQSLSSFATAFGYFASNSPRNRSSALRASARAGRLGHLVQQPLGARLQPLGERVEHVRCLVNPAALLPRAGEHVAQRGPRAERAVAGHELRLAHAAVVADRGTPPPTSPRSRGSRPRPRAAPCRRPRGRRSRPAGRAESSPSLTATLTPSTNR